MKTFDTYSKIIDMNENFNSSFTLPELHIEPVKPLPIDYKDTILAEMAEDIKTPFQEQVLAIKVIAEASVSQANSARDVAVAAQAQVELLTKQITDLQRIVNIQEDELKIYKNDIASNSKSSKLSTYIAFSALIISALSIIVDIVAIFT